MFNIHDNIFIEDTIKRSGWKKKNVLKKVDVNQHKIEKHICYDNQLTIGNISYKN